jgi:leader peptidase (prepilin peptidase)/N-methyltransferase
VGLFVIAFVVLVLGLVFGSFANVLIYRLPLNISIVRPGSFCPACKEPLSADEKLPLMSYLSQGGRCLHCKEKISLRYPLIELAMALGWLGLLLHYGAAFEALVGAVLFFFLLTTAATDITSGLIPDKLTIPMMIIGFALSFYPFGLTPFSSLLGVLIGGGLLLLFALLGKVIFKREAMGGGDLKLLAGIGAFVGWEAVLLTAFIAVLTGAIYGAVYQGITKKKELRFGPFLALGGLVAFLFSDTILGWYLSL